MKKHARMETIKKDFRLNKAVYLMLLPVVAYYLLFAYGPMYGALIAFKDFIPRLGTLGSPWVGLKHFVVFFKSPSFFSLLYNTLHISITSLVFGFPMPIILALLLNELKSVRFSRLVQNATYLPHFISLVVVCGLVKDFTRDTGIITYLLSFAGVPQVTLLNFPQYFVPVYVTSGIWQEVGWGSIIYLAALTGVDASLYEAATIDGANKWKQVWHVTLPGILPTIVVMFILRTGSIMSVGYEKIILLYNDATLEAADVISTYVYRKGILEQSWSFSTAVNMFNSVVNLIFLLSANVISRKVNDISLW
jgi:putative aldouronate transport system permease protein